MEDCKEQQKQQHLEFIQNVVNRMNTNSFQLKELTVLIITACLAIYASDKNIWMILVPILPTAVFWYIDAYYLLQERKFRAMYDDVAGVTNPPINQVKLYQMSVREYTVEKGVRFSMWNAFKSITVRNFYGILIISLILIFVCIQCITVTK